MRSGRFTAMTLAVCALSSCAAAPATQPDGSTARLLNQWGAANGQCRGGSGNEAATWEACERRDELSDALNREGLCYGKQTQYGYQHEWHACGSDSYR